MKSFNYIIKDEIGIHARPAGLLVKLSKDFISDITLECNGKSADIKRLLALMGLGVKKGSNITITAKGEDEENAIKILEEFFTNNL